MKMVIRSEGVYLKINHLDAHNLRGVLSCIGSSSVSQEMWHILMEHKRYLLKEAEKADLSLVDYLHWLEKKDR